LVLNCTTGPKEIDESLIQKETNYKKIKEKRGRKYVHHTGKRN